jgi:hypothetical protein
MSNLDLVKELRFKKDWVFDPPPMLIDKIRVQDLARLVVVQLKAQQTILQAQESALAEMQDIYSSYLK